MKKSEILRAKLKQDEFSRGYRGRLKTLNNFELVKDFVAALIADSNIQDSKSSGQAEIAALAQAAGVTFETFLKSYSLQPLFLMVPPGEKAAKQSESLQLEANGWYGLRTWEKIGARFCPSCIDEEMESLGYAYWHQSHQIPGVCWCTKHGEQLATSALGKSAFDTMPSWELDATFEFGEDEFQEIFTNNAVQRYAEIAFTLLESNANISAIHAIYRMSEQLKERQIRVGEKGQRPTFTDRLLAQFPLPWLLSHYPSIINRGPGEYFHAIDSIASRPVANHVYILGLSSFFETSSDATAYWFSNTDGLPKARKTNRRKEFWNSNEIYEIYVENRGNHTRIAALLDSDFSSTSNALNAAGLPALRKHSMAKIGNAISAIKHGMPIDLACKDIGVRQRDVERLLTGDTDKLLLAIRKVEPSLRC